jgi:excisionase family DNA binding protein
LQKKGLWLRAAASGPWPSRAAWPQPRRLAGGDKRRQTSPRLKFSALSDEVPLDRKPTEVQETPPVSIPSAQPRNDRRLVFTSSQAARYVGVSLATVRRWTDAGHIDCYRTPGGQRRFSRAQLDDFIASMQRNGGASEDAAVERRDAQVA